MAKRNITLHDKYKSITALYPKIDASSFTQGAIEKVAEISKEEVENNVVPNETPTGTPETLEYITINGVEYKIENGTLVIANPTLAGTEVDLTGIQIGDIKYKIPSATPTPQVQSNWNETDTDSPAYIQNKPTIPQNVITYNELMKSSTPLSGDGSLDVPVNEMQNTDNYVEVSGYAYVTGSSVPDRKRFTMRIKQTPQSGAGYVERPNYFIDYNSTEDASVYIRGYFYYNTSNLKLSFNAYFTKTTVSTSYTIVVEHIKEIINY